MPNIISKVRTFSTCFDPTSVRRTVGGLPPTKFKSTRVPADTGFNTTETR